ncbi:hypothetical protein V8C42DRAFT_320002 [Trichoderma barbatum]
MQMRSLSISPNNMTTPAPSHHGLKLEHTQGSGAERVQLGCIQPSINNGNDGLGKRNNFALGRLLKEPKKNEPFNLLAVSCTDQLHHLNSRASTVILRDGTSSVGYPCEGNAAEPKNGDNAAMI